MLNTLYTIISLILHIPLGENNYNRKQLKTTKLKQHGGARIQTYGLLSPEPTLLQTVFPTTILVILRKCLCLLVNRVVFICRPRLPISKLLLFFFCLFSKAEFQGSHFNSSHSQSVLFIFPPTLGR